MHFLSPSLSVTALNLFVAAGLAATDAQSGCEETFTRSGTTTVIDLCKLAPTNDASTTTVPPHPKINHPDSLAGCLTTVTENGVTAVISLCNFDTSTTTAPPHPKISHPHPHARCLTTVTKNGVTAVISLCNDDALPSTDSPVVNSVSSRVDECLTTLIGTDGHPTVFECGSLGRAVTPTTGTSPPAQTPISHNQFSAACLTTLTKPDGQVVVVNCGEGFFSGHPRTTTAPAPASTPTTICIEDRCFEVIGSFGSATSTSAAPTKTHFQDEL